MHRPNHMSGPNFKMEIPDEKVSWNDGNGRSRKNQNINELFPEISESSFLCQNQKDK